MTTPQYALFQTPIGQCGIVWTARGIAGVRFPERHEDELRARVLKRFPGAIEAPPPPHIENATKDVVALLNGEKRDLSHITIDDSGIPEFNRRVYAIISGIPPGETLTYGDIAKRLGDPLLAREVGVALGQNPTPIIVPCHRILAAGGKTGGFSGGDGVETKLRLLTIEGAQPSGPTLFDSLPLQTCPSVMTRRT